MPGFRNFKGIIDAYDAGRFKVSSWRKALTQTTGTGIWFDLSMSPGNPVPNYYAASPLQAKALSRSSDYGIDHGGGVAPMKKHLKGFTAIATTSLATPLPIILCDYLMYYPFVDMSVAGGEFQPFDNGTATLPRYTDGNGVQMMAVEVAAQIGGSQFYCTYTNQDGVPGRVTGTATCNTQVTNGTIVTSSPALIGSMGPFMQLQAGDTGVRSIDGVTFLGAGDVGLITMVLVKPLATHSILEITAPVERCFACEFQSLPVVEDDAYLNMICLPNGTLSGAQLTGLAEFVWG